ncbi:Uu.00g134020.m01.CDS01 [Anthostomella pinea]|uniref:Uu.00g134020.m01.CDS01 n=1 Tax=Anthostomella pinea TaxID=933095 RepID=A0AAI8VNV1_9PEZI|nr:Uu.00g134020.m01.CDS01 [Anthostomella pinea]
MPPTWTPTEIEELLLLDLETIVDRQAKAAAAQWFFKIRLQLDTDRVAYQTNQKFYNSAHRRRNFEVMIQKALVGEPWELEIFRPMRPDIRLLRCASLLPTQLKQVHTHGLTGCIGDLVFKATGPWTVPVWLRERFEMVLIEMQDPRAGLLLQGLSFLSHSARSVR